MTTVRLGDLCLVESGGTPSRKSAANFEGNIPWVKIGDMLQGTITRTEEAISEQGLSSSSAKVWPIGTLLVSIFATIGRTAILGIPAASNQAIAGLQVDSSKIDAGYLRRYLDSSVEALAASGRGIAQNNINMSMLRNWPVPVPHLDEQRRIAAILDKADELRTKRRQALAHLETLTQSIFHSMFGDAHENPMNWPTHDLGALLEFGPQNGMYLPASEYGTGAPIVRIDSFRGGVVNELSSLKRLRASLKDLKTYGLRAGDILINRVNSIEHLGKSAVVPELLEPTVFESNMMRCRFDGNRIHPEYLRTALMSDHMYGQIVRRAKRAVNQASINQTDVKEMKILVPPPELQQTFATRVAAVERLKESHRKHLAELDALFASLQHRAFKGEL